MRYRTLLELRLRHPYHPGGRCPDFDVHAFEGGPRLCDPETGARKHAPDQERRLAQHRLVIVARPDGLDLLCPTIGADPLVPFLDSLALRFHLRPRSRDFPLYTDLAQLAALAHPVFATTDVPAAGGEDLTLRPGSVPLPRGTLADVEIRGVRAQWLDAPPRFTVSFAASARRWAYYVALAPGSDPPTIVDPTTSESRPFSTRLLAGDEDDAVAADLARRHPDATRFRLLSNQPIAASSVSDRSLGLSVGGEVRIGALPNPPLRQFITLGLGGSAPEPALYQILEL